MSPKLCGKVAIGAYEVKTGQTLSSFSDYVVVRRRASRPVHCVGADHVFKEHDVDVGNVGKICSNGRHLEEAERVRNVSDELATVIPHQESWPDDPCKCGELLRKPTTEVISIGDKSLDNRSWRRSSSEEDESGKKVLVFGANGTCDEIQPRPSSPE